MSIFCGRKPAREKSEDRSAISRHAAFCENPRLQCLVDQSHPAVSKVAASKLTLRLESAAFDFEQAILMANSLRDHERYLWLLQADGRLVVLRSLIRYTLDWHLLGGKQIQYAAEAIDELGRLLGAWLKGIDRIAPAPTA